MSSKGIPSSEDDRTCFRKSFKALNNNSNFGKSSSTLAFSTKAVTKKSRVAYIKFTNSNDRQGSASELEKP
jgi:hypothetical protein